LDWGAVERTARTVATSGPRTSGPSLLRLRNRLIEIVDEATPAIEEVSGMAVDPHAQLMVVDRHSWIAGNVRTLERVMGDLEISGAGSKVVAWEGGALVGLLARVVLGQYDPFRDQLLVVYPNLGTFSDPSGLRWLLFHELTHVAQFRAAPWMADAIAEAGRQAMKMDEEGLGREAMRQLRRRLPEVLQWMRKTLRGEQPPDMETLPLLDVLPPEQRDAILAVHAMVTVLEGHATHVTDLVARRALPDYEQVSRRIEERKRRPPLMKLVETIFGLENKRRQYVVGRRFCEMVWEQGGADALGPAWLGPEGMPTSRELHHPDEWLSRVAA
jgi:coenzyme F420 biosynthesis associated uncharacterized protein